MENGCRISSIISQDGVLCPLRVGRLFVSDVPMNRPEDLCDQQYISSIPGHFVILVGPYGIEHSDTSNVALVAFNLVFPINIGICITVK
jgi:hypothetical protein